jgi:putative membrane protein insertion efficiency factor
MSDRSGILRLWCIRKIETYRTEVRPRIPDPGCRFTPSCSSYALEALNTKRTPVALAMIVWRLLRCNPLTRHGHHDPVTRRHRRRRPNALRTASATLLLGGLLMVFVASAAFGQSISSGCSGTVNGRPPQSLTSSSPLVVGKGESITVAGQGPSKAGGGINGNYSISIVEGLFNIDRRNENWTGTGSSFQSGVNVDNYLKYGSGLYKVEGVATAAAGWSCTASFYIKLDGSKIIGIVAAGLAGIGALGGIRSAKPAAGAFPADAEPAAAMGGPTTDELKTQAYDDLIGPSADEPPKKKPKMDDIDRLANSSMSALGCLLAFAGIVLGMLFWAVVLPVSMNLPDAAKKRVWVKGKPVLGFFSGLVGGLGATVALQQFGFWPLTTLTAIGFPVFVAIVGGWRGWRGSAYKVG